MNNSCVNRKELHALLFQASRDGELVYYILNNKTHLDRWDFSGAFGFSISVVTTIGQSSCLSFVVFSKANRDGGRAQKRKKISSFFPHPPAL